MKSFTLTPQFHAHPQIFHSLPPMFPRSPQNFQTDPPIAPGPSRKSSAGNQKAGNNQPPETSAGADANSAREARETRLSNAYQLVERVASRLADTVRQVASLPGGGGRVVLLLKVSSRHLGPVDPSFRALSELLLYILHFEPSLDALTLRPDVISSINKTFSFSRWWMRRC